MPRSSLVAALLALASPAAAQEAAGTQLWRLMSTTLPVPPALASGASGTFWNPAQAAPGGAFVASLDVIQTPPAIGATGFLVTARWSAGRVGTLGIGYGRVGLRDLVRTTVSPDPAAAPIPYDAQTGGFTWSRDVAGVTVGAALRHHLTRLDAARGQRWTVDVGAARRVGPAVRLAAATRFLSSLDGDAAQDVFAGIEYRWFRGPLWRGGREADLWARYGVAVGHGFAADHFFGVGLAIGDALALDVLLAREGGYAGAGWRPVGGVRVGVGRYRLTLAREAGVRDIGSAFRVGLEARLP